MNRRSILAVVAGVVFIIVATLIDVGTGRVRFNEA